MTNKLNGIVKATQCDTDFWMYQIAQHALFLSKLLDGDYVPKLKDEAAALYKELYCTVKEPVIQYNCKLLTSMYALLFTISGRTHNESGLTKELSDEDFRTLIQHMIIEQTYYVRLYAGQLTVEDELLFWSRENEQHTKLVAHLLPPSDLRDRLAVMSDSVRENNLLSNMDPMYFSDELGLITHSNQLASVVHAGVLDGSITSVDRDTLEHEMREAQRGEERIKSLISYLQE